MQASKFFKQAIKSTTAAFADAIIVTEGAVGQAFGILADEPLQKAAQAPRKRTPADALFLPEPEHQQASKHGSEADYTDPYDNALDKPSDALALPHKLPDRSAGTAATTRGNRFTPQSQDDLHRINAEMKETSSTDVEAEGAVAAQEVVGWVEGDVQESVGPCCKDSENEQDSQDDKAVVEADTASPTVLLSRSQAPGTRQPLRQPVMAQPDVEQMHRPQQIEHEVTFEQTSVFHGSEQEALQYLDSMKGKYPEQLLQRVSALLQDITLQASKLAVLLLTSLVCSCIIGTGKLLYQVLSVIITLVGDVLHAQICGSQ